MNILFICTGNTCRSPMAQCLFMNIAKEKGLSHTADSAGLFAGNGSPASMGAKTAMKRRGLSLEGHASKQVDEALCQKADKIICMTLDHLYKLLEYYPELAQKADVFESPVNDPFGGNDATYEKTALQIEALINKWLAANK